MYLWINCKGKTIRCTNDYSKYDKAQYFVARSQSVVDPEICPRGARLLAKLGGPARPPSFFD